MEHRLAVHIAADNIISALGFATQENLMALRAYASGITVSQRVSDYPMPVALISNERLQQLVAEQQLAAYTRVEQLAILSIRDTLSQTNIDISSPECGLIISTTKGNISLIENNTSNIPTQAYLWNIAKTLATHFYMKSEPMLVSNACVSGVSAIIVAQRLLQEGKFKHILVVGVDELSHFITSGFASFKSISSEACKPYDSNRDGLSLGEACASMLLTVQPVENSIQVCGGAITNDANHISGPSRTGDGLYYAIRGAMSEAGVAAADVSCVNLHGTATVYNDEMESKAMQLAGLTAVPANSLKPYFGHTLGASGVVESIVCAHQLKEGVVYGTLGYSTCGVPYQLTVSAEHTAISTPTVCVKTASGFGGCNAAIVLATSQHNSHQNNQPASYELLKICTIEQFEVRVNASVEFSGNDESFANFIRAAFKALGESNQKFYKMDNLCKLGYVAASYLLKGVEFLPLEMGLVLANASSSLDTDVKHQQLVDAGGDTAASPAVFVYTLPNVVAGEICIRHKIQGENIFFINHYYNDEELEQYAKIAMTKSNLTYCIVGWCDFLNNQYKAEFRLLKRK